MNVNLKVLAAKRHLQRGLTMVEIMVAMGIMSFVILATITLLSVASASYKTVDASEELNDTSRFIISTIGVAARNAGFEPQGVNYGAQATGYYTTTIPPIWGANNSPIPAAGTSSDTNYGANNTTGAINNSDVVVFRFYGTSRSGAPDGTMVDCRGIAQGEPTGTSALGVSAFHVRDSGNGEPELHCKSRSSSGNFDTWAIARGVETFQVVYGIDTNNDDIIDAWVSAQDVPAASWRYKVQAVKVGFILRGPVGSSQAASTTSAQNTYYPFGAYFQSNASSEVGLSFTPANAGDGRLRRAYSATFQLRNSARTGQF